MKTEELIEKFIRKYTIRKGHRSVAEDEAEIKSDLTELLKQHVIEFTLSQSPRTPIIIDGEKKVRERIEKLYNEWITNK